MLIYWLHMLAEKFDIMCLLILGFCRRTDKFGCLGLQIRLVACACGYVGGVCWLILWLHRLTDKIGRYAC